MLWTVKFRAPANVFLRRAQISLILGALIPTVLTTPVGIVLLATGTGSVAIVAGVLVLAFCTSSLTGWILGSMFVSRGASLARVQSDFFSSVSHELRTPITSIKMFVETLRDERVTDPEERKTCLTIMHQEMDRLEGLVQKLMDLSKLESGQQAFAKNPVAIDEVVDEALGALKATVLGDPVDVKAEVESDLTTTGDKSALVQAVANLLVNAYKYTPEHKKVIQIVARARSDKHIEIAVTDNGPGIAPHEERHIFEPFGRGSAAIKNRQPGSGLGLAIVRGVAKVHRGKVELVTELGQGTTFSLLLPRRS